MAETRNNCIADKFRTDNIPIPKGILSLCKRYPFALQKDTFRDAKSHLLLTSFYQPFSCHALPGSTKLC